MKLRPLLAPLLAITFLLGLASAAAAECTETDPWPRFSRVAAAGHTIVLVEVEEILARGPSGRPTTYRLRVLETVKGESEPVLSAHRVYSNSPTRDCSGHWLIAEIGDRLALAYGIPRDSVKGRISAVAFLNEPAVRQGEGMEVLTAAQVRAIAGLPDTSTSAAAAVEQPWQRDLLILAAGLSGAVAAVWSHRRRTRATAV
jgi:hypothetical protein